MMSRCFVALLLLVSITTIMNAMSDGEDGMTQEQIEIFINNYSIFKTFLFERSEEYPEKLKLFLKATKVRTGRSSRIPYYVSDNKKNTAVKPDSCAQHTKDIEQDTLRMKGQSGRESNVHRRAKL